MRFKGDRRGEPTCNGNSSMIVGGILGPGLDELYRQITSIEYDEVADVTTVEAEQVGAFSQGGNLVRFYGSADPTEPPPEVRERIPDKIKAR